MAFLSLKAFWSLQGVLGRRLGTATPGTRHRDVPSGGAGGWSLPVPWCAPAPGLLGPGFKKKTWIPRPSVEQRDLSSHQEGSHRGAQLVLCCPALPGGDAQ